MFKVYIHKYKNFTSGYRVRKVILRDGFGNVWK